MKRRIIRRPRAMADLDDQTLYYLEIAGDEVARRFLSAAEETLERLCGHAPAHLLSRLA